MARHHLAAIAAVSALGCGDNASLCGEGTVVRSGVCIPANPVTCGAGTKLDHNQCVVDPVSCGAGTVFIAGRCVDPTAGLTIDLEESAEPNGLAIAPGVEASDAPAGIVVLAASDVTLVVHGHLTPFRDADGDGQLDPDVDSFLVTVAAPTLLDVTVDGVGGVLGAFYATANPQTTPPYERYGVSATGDTARRRLFLPAAGRYAFAIADTRSIAIGRNPPPVAGAGAAAGGPDAEYYVSFTVRPVPAAAPIAITGGAGSQGGTLSAGEVKFYSAAFGASAEILDAMPGAATASVAVLDAGRLAGYADENPGPPPALADVVVSAIPPGDVPVIVADAVYNDGPAAEPFMLTITVR